MSAEAHSSTAKLYSLTVSLKFCFKFYFSSNIIVYV